MSPVKPFLWILTLTICAAACGSAPDTIPPANTPTAASVTTEPPASPAATAEPTPAPDGFLFPAGANLLELARGEARISHDNGATWEGTDTGQPLVSGDRIQVASEGIGLIHLLNGGIIRLEGPTDFILQMAEGDPATGKVEIIGIVWDGRALFQTPPLLTPDSKFQLQVLSGLLHARYDPDWADAYRAAVGMPDGLMLVGGGLLDEEVEIEKLVHVQGPVSLVEVEQLDQGFPMLEHRTDGRGTGTIIVVPYREDLDSELEIEAFLPTAGFLIAGYRQNSVQERPNAMGYLRFDLGATDTGDEAYLAAPEAGAPLLEAGLSNPDNRRSYIRQYLPRFRSAVSRFRNASIPDILVADRLLLQEDAAFGCDPVTGRGCPLPENCEPDSGTGCELTGSCNPVTGEGCQPTGKRIDFTDTSTDSGTNEYWRGSRVRLARPPLCDVAVPGDCGRPYKIDHFTEDFEDDENIAWCLCTAKVPPGWPPPPPGMNMQYKCWCNADY